MILIAFNNGIACVIFRNIILHIGQHGKSCTGIAIWFTVSINRL